MYKYLDKIESPSDIKCLNNDEIKLLAKEIRDFLIENVSESGGHLASNLGVVEITLALYKIFDAPEDKIIFDVGHQSYVSKILTGRRKLFYSLRNEDGISGFPKISESEYDSFGTGHSSTALSAALGIARANKLSGSDDYVIAVVGDGAFSGGLVYEAMNNCENDLNLILILNENEMSISHNVGNMAHLISGIRSKENYFRIKNAVQRFFEGIPLVGKSVVSGMRKIKKFLKNAIFNANIVENFGFTYYGPIDGNDYTTVERLLVQAKKHGGSAFIHMKTKKGKGYTPAEENPSAYHMVKPRGALKYSNTFSSVFGEIAVQLGQKDTKVCAITAAMMDGTCLDGYFEKFPERSFDVGIAEAHAVTFAAGLSIAGYKPIFAVYSSFLQRSFDSLLHDIALQNLHCIFAVDRAGLSPDDGATHHGIYDVSMLSLVKDAVIFSPISFSSMRTALETAVSSENGIFSVRYPKGTENLYNLVKAEEYIYTDSEKMAKNVIVTYGRIFEQALLASEELKKHNVDCSVLVLEKLTPYCESYETILRFCKNCDSILILEEGIACGGFGQNILSVNDMSQKPLSIGLLAISAPPGHAKLETLYSVCGISAQNIVDYFLKSDS